MRLSCPLYALMVITCVTFGCNDDDTGTAVPAGPAMNPADMSVDLDQDTPPADDGSRDQGEPDEGSPEDMPLDMPPGVDLPSDIMRTFQELYPLEIPFSESGIYDPTDHVFYVGSLQTGGVYRVDAQTGQSMQMYTEKRAGAWWTLGMDVDVERRKLWVCSMADLRDAPEGSPTNAGYVLEIDLNTDEVLNEIDLGDAFPGATCADVAITKAGTPYVCDRSHPHIYRINEDASVTLWAQGDALSGEVVGQNALIVLPDQSALLSLVYLTPKLVHIDLESAQVTQVEIQGEFFDFIPPASGADGLAWSDGAALVMFTSQLNRITPTSADWSTATSQTVEIPPSMTGVIHTPNGDYMLNGQALTFAIQGEPDPTALTLFTGEF